MRCLVLDRADWPIDKACGEGVHLFVRVRKRLAED